MPQTFLFPLYSYDTDMYRTLVYMTWQANVQQAKLLPASTSFVHGQSTALSYHWLFTPNTGHTLIVGPNVSLYTVGLALSINAHI